MRRFLSTLMAVSIVFVFAADELHAGAGVARLPASVSDDLVERYRSRIQQTLQATSQMRPDCATCGQFATGADDQSLTCHDTYQKLYKVKPDAADEEASDRVLDIRIAFGYMDFNDTTEDRYASYAFASGLLAPCRPNTFACGFKQSADDAEVFTKQVSVLGPDGVTRRRTINLRMRCSSVTDDERINRGDEADAQDAQSADTEKFFAEGLKNSDVVFYIGHARDGGGPGFSPPVVNKKTRHTDFSWYHEHQPGVNMMNEAIGPSGKAPAVIGIFACYAQDHFSDWLHALAPRSGLILSGQQEFEASVSQATGALDSLLGQRCEKQFNQSVDVLKNVNDLVITPVHVDHFFQ